VNSESCGIGRVSACVCRVHARHVSYFIYISKTNVITVIYHTYSSMFFYPEIFILLFHITVAGNSHCIVCLVALSANRLVRNSIVFVYCVDCGQILRILSVSVGMYSMSVDTYNMSVDVYSMSVDTYNMSVDMYSLPCRVKRHVPNIIVSC
jgi:hypothetical protein